MKHLRWSFSVGALGASFLLGSPLVAQDKIVPTADVIVANSPDDKWAELLAAQKKRKDDKPGGTRSTAAGAADIASGFLARAGNFRKFADENTKHPKAKEARRQEALMLLRAGLAGDDSAAPRRDSLAADLRKDPGLTPDERCEVAATADNLTVSRQKHAGVPQRLLARETVARGLMKEFPTVDAGYDSLLQIGKASESARAVEIYADLADDKKAPARVRQAAKALLERHALVGLPISKLLAGVTAPGDLLSTMGGRKVVIYSWSCDHLASIEQSRRLGAMPLGDAVIIGVSLDRDVAAAKALASAKGLPGTILYPEKKAENVFAQRLVLTEPGLVFLADAQGVLRDVAAHVNVTAAFAALPVRTP